MTRGQRKDRARLLPASAIEAHLRELLRNPDGSERPIVVHGSSCAERWRGSDCDCGLAYLRKQMEVK